MSDNARVRHYLKWVAIRMLVLMPITLLLVAGYTISSGEVVNYWSVLFAMWTIAPIWELAFPTKGR